MRAVHFGAGNIGRGFIGLLLRESGYDLTFVDANPDVVRLINELGEYPVTVVGPDGTYQKWVRGVRALHSGDTEALTLAIAEADLVTTAVGKSALQHVAPVIARGINLRKHDGLAIIVVACENVLGNSAYLASLVREQAHLPDDAFAELATFPNCVVDRIVPNADPTTPPTHPLEVTVEEYAQWAIDASHLLRRPAIVGADYRDGLEAVVAQKLFTLNMAHAIVGYYGRLSGHTFIHEAVADERIRTLLDGALTEANKALVAQYGLDPVAQTAYATKTILRLTNSALRDRVVRVCREPRRKLGHDDRLIRPAMGALDAGTVPAHLATGVAAALLYDDPSDGDAAKLAQAVRDLGPRKALATIAGVDEHHALAELVQANVFFRKL